MTTRRATPAGLSTDDVDRIRSSLAGGRKPKVVFTEAAGQVAGQVGQVVKLTDPEQSDDWLVVRFGKDELPFSPADLSLPPRGRTGRSKPAAARQPKAAAPPEPRAPSKAQPSKAQPSNEQPPQDQPAQEQPAKRQPSKTAAEPSPAVPAPRAGAAAENRRPAKRAAKAARSARPRSPASMTVTLAYEAGEWTVSAHQGSKTLAKPYLVRPTDALKMVSMLDVPGVHDAVEQIVTAELTEAQRRADTLRSELAEVEARLAELRDAG